MSVVKKIFVIIVILGLLGGGAYYWLNSKRHAMGALVQPMLTDMAEHNWRMQTVSNYASPEFKRWYRRHGNQTTFEQFRALGPVMNFGQVLGFEQKVQDGVTLAQIVLRVDFAQAARIVKIKLIKRDTPWQFYHIDLFLPNVAFDSR